MSGWANYSDREIGAKVGRGAEWGVGVMIVSGCFWASIKSMYISCSPTATTHTISQKQCGVGAFEVKRCASHIRLWPAGSLGADPVKNTCCSCSATQST